VRQKVLPHTCALQSNTGICSLQAVEAEGVELYDPFIRMLQFGLEPLLLGGDGSPAGTHLPVAATILRAVKRAQDAAPEPQTERM
jgi:hypothetical protein